ncbi:MAG: DUF3617 family protein [Vicinamibacterales bacterium]
MRTLPFSLLIAATTLAALPVFGEDPPKRKSGLWEIKTSAAAVDEARIVQMCVDQKADNITGPAAATAKKMCSKTDLHHTGDRLTIDSVCKFGATTATTHSIITGKFDSAYRVETSSTYDPPLGGMKQSVATIEARWLGPCAADQKPGDMILGNGLKINIYDNTGTRTPKAKE